MLHYAVFNCYRIGSRKWTRSINKNAVFFEKIMKKTIAAITVSLLCASAWAQTYDPANGEYYEVVAAQNIPWINAEEDALTMYYAGLEGHLVTLTSQAEDTFVGTLAQNTQLPGAGEVWAGGYQNPANEQVAGDGWTWVNNEGTFPGVDSTTPFANWNPGEPNDAGGPGSEQFLGLNLNGSDVGGFNDEGNLYYISGYVVEFDPSTVPSGGLATGYAPDGGSTAGLLGGVLTLLGIASRRLRK